MYSTVCARAACMPVRRTIFPSRRRSKKERNGRILRKFRSPTLACSAVSQMHRNRGRAFASCVLIKGARASKATITLRSVVEGVCCDDLNALEGPWTHLGQVWRCSCVFCVRRPRIARTLPATPCDHGISLASMFCRLCVRNLQHPAFKYSCLICCLLPLGNRMDGPEHRQWVLSHAADLAFIAGRSTG